MVAAGVGEPDLSGCTCRQRAGTTAASVPVRGGAPPAEVAGSTAAQPGILPGRRLRCARKLSHMVRVWCAWRWSCKAASRGTDMTQMISYNAAEVSHASTDLATKQSHPGVHHACGRAGRWVGATSQELAATATAGCSALPEDAATPLVLPDFGQQPAPARSGAVAVGATGWVTNLNIPLATANMATARLMAQATGYRGGGLPAVEAMALPHTSGASQHFTICSIVHSRQGPHHHALFSVACGTEGASQVACKIALQKAVVPEHGQPLVSSPHDACNVINSACTPWLATHDMQLLFRP